MKNFYNLNDIKDINQSIDEILDIKNNIGKYQKIFDNLDLYFSKKWKDKNKIVSGKEKNLWL